MNNKINIKSCQYSIKITPKQRKEVDFFSEMLNINKSTFGFMGTVLILGILNETWKDVSMDRNQFKKCFFNPSHLNKGYLIKPVLINMDFQERMQYELMIQVAKQNQDNNLEKEE